MELAEFIQKDMVEFLDMIVRAAIEHDKRSEQEISALLEKTGMSDKQKQEVNTFLGPVTGSAANAPPGAITSSVPSSDPMQQPQQQIQAQQIVIQQNQQPVQAPPQPVAPQQTQPSIMQAGLATSAQGIPLVNKEEELASDGAKVIDNPEKPAQDTPELPKPKDLQPSLPTPGIVQEKKEDPFALMHDKQRQQRVASQDLPFGHSDSKDRSSLTEDYELGNVARNSRRSELTKIAHFSEKIKQIRKFIHEKRYTKAIALHKDLQEEGFRLQYHPAHRKKLMNILMGLESEIIQKRALLKPIKIPEDDPKKEQKEELNREIYRIKTKVPKTAGEHIIESQKVTGAHAYVAKKGKKSIPHKEAERFSRLHNEKYKAALHALRTKDYHKAKQLFLQLLKERPNNNGLRVRLAQSMAGVSHGN